MPQQKDYPEGTTMTAARLDEIDRGIITRILALHPYLKGTAQAIRLALHYWSEHNPEDSQPTRRDINISRGE